MMTLSSSSSLVGVVLLQLVNLSWWSSISSVSADLIVNVRNQGGESYKQTIRANLTDETVRLSFGGYDGGSTVMVIDFRNEIQLVHTIRLGDQEENQVVNNLDGVDINSISNNNVNGGQFGDVGGGGGVEFEDGNMGKLSTKKKGGGGGRLSSSSSLLVKSPAVYKSYCFVTKFKAQEFIPVDAMAKLRQKNPWSLRTPERSEPLQNITFDILLDPTASDWISPAIREECWSSSDGSFVTSTYAVKLEISERAVNPEDYLRAVRDIVVEDDGRGCGGSSGGGSGKPCVCTASVCIGWYPCSLKFCRARSSASGNNSTSSLMTGGGGGSNNNNAQSSSGSPSADNSSNNFKTYRCGIHTCRICRNCIFGVTSGLECLQ